MNRFAPKDVLQLRQEILYALATLHEQQIRTHLIFGAIDSATARAQTRFANRLTELASRLDAAPELVEIQHECLRWQRVQAHLKSYYESCLRKQSESLRRLLHYFEITSRELVETLVEKELLVRHRKVLERVVLSYDRVIHWREFVEEILFELHRIFPFDIFFIAFSEKHGLSLYLFYSATPTESQRQRVETWLSREVLRRLGQPDDSAFDIKVRMLDLAPWKVTEDSLQLLCQPVPDYRQGLAGILGVAFGMCGEISAQEEEVIRSLLAVIVIVVGSSRTLSHTLQELEYYALHDPLTHLYNRRHFLAMLDYEIGRSRRHHHPFSLLMIDLDDFKDINDTYGHPTGDVALQEVAEILRTTVRQGDLVCRLGGDEFVLLLPETAAAGARTTARKLRERLRAKEIATSETSFHLTCSIGGVTYPADGDTATSLLAHLDLAIYEAKRRGKDEVCLYEEMRQAGFATNEDLGKLREEAEVLRVALKEGRIVPYFQPIREIKTGRIVAYEVLARLLEKEGGVIPAGRFIGAIEKYGLGRELDRHIIAQALSILREKGEFAPRLFLNLSAQEIQHRNILGFAARLCHQWRIAPGQIVFELLERDAVSDIEKVRMFIAQLRKKGFRFALDDFGSGYNSFHYLRELEFDFVKIDGAFIRGIETSFKNDVLVRNLARLCRELGIQTVAEHVESEAILRRLQKLGITHAQGYHLGLPRSELE
jgi:diguanylate cyclase (GGDEF)-like protein